MLAPGLANVVLVQHFVLGVFAHLFYDFGSLLDKHLFLGRTLLLRLQGYQTYVGAAFGAHWYGGGWTVGRWVGLQLGRLLVWQVGRLVGW